MALSNDSTLQTRGRSIGAYQLTNAVTAYAGALMAMNRATGRAVLWSDAANLSLLGLAMRKAVGDTSASPIVEVEVNESGVVLKTFPVTGASAITNVGDRVYATDDNTLTLTPTVNVGAIGTVVRYLSGTNCDVRLLTPSEYEAQEDIA